MTSARRAPLSSTMLATLLSAATLAATPVATDGQVVAWWGNDRGHDVALTFLRPGSGRRPRRIEGLKPGPIGFWDLDVGRGPGGAPWAVYTHCLRGGCRPWAVDLRTGIRRSLGVGRGRAAAIWGYTVVFTRHGRLYRARLHRPGSVRRLPAPAHVRVLQVELRRDRLAYLTRQAGEDARWVAVWTQPLSAHAAPRRPRVNGGSGEECTHDLASPTLSASGLTFLVAGAGDPAVCGAGSRTTLVTPTGTRRAPTGALAAVIARGRTVVLAPPRAKADRFDRDRCSRWGGAHVVGCEIRLD